MIDAFVTYIQAERRYSALTVRNYRHDIESFAAWCTSNVGIPAENFDFSKVTTEDIREWIIYRTDTNKVSAASINREISSLRSFYKFLRTRGHVKKDVFARITNLRTPRKLPSFVPESRMEPLLDNLRERSCSSEFIEQRNALIITLLYSCGIRLAELLSIRIGDISDSAMTLFVRGKGDKHRVVPLITEIIPRIREYIKCMEEAGFDTSAEAPLIVSVKGRSLNRTTVQKIVEKELTEAQVQGKKSPHILRHTFATHLLNKEADMRDIQELMGHSSLRTTQNYTHNSITQLRDIYKRAHPHK
jgi:integrase/recombinase XerC